MGNTQATNKKERDEMRKINERIPVSSDLKNKLKELAEKKQTTFDMVIRELGGWTE